MDYLFCRRITLRREEKLTFTIVSIATNLNKNRNSVITPFTSQMWQASLSTRWTSNDWSNVRMLLQLVKSKKHGPWMDKEGCTSLQHLCCRPAFSPWNKPWRLLWSRWRAMTEYKIEVLRGHARSDGWILFNKSDSLSKARKIAANAMLHTDYLAVRIV